MSDDNHITRIQSLLQRAGHPNTPEEEARSCALIAAKLIVKHDYTVTKKKTEPENTDYQYSYWRNRYRNVNMHDTPSPDEIKKGDIYRVQVCKSRVICVKCNKQINYGEIVATVRFRGATHYRCRHHWKETITSQTG